MCEAMHPVSAGCDLKAETIAWLQKTRQVK
jgi:hypothetical protein